MSSFLQLALALPIIILAAKAGGWISVRLKQPAVLGELVTPILLRAAFPRRQAQPGRVAVGEN